MESIENYRDIIERIFEKWQQWPGKEAKFEVLPITDKEHDRYLLLTQGWDGFKRIHGLLTHLDIIGDKIWIQEDNTEEGIATDLLDAGMPKDRIVLAVQHPERRKWGDFATT